MAGSKTTDTKETWTTGEELLLACAVRRHGFRNWASVAMELRAQTSHTTLLPTPQDCRRKYEDLKRRFTDSGVSGRGDAEDDDPSGLTVPWLDELRKLRVEELRQERSIFHARVNPTWFGPFWNRTLELKVMRLKEERGSDSKENRNRKGKPDPVRDSKERRPEDCSKDGDEVEEPWSREEPEQSVSAGESNRGNLSCNESNSTGENFSNHSAGSERAGRKPESPGPGSEGPGPMAEDSYPGSTDTQREAKDRPYGELAGAAAGTESKGRGRAHSAARENCDLQSSASPSREGGRRRRGRRRAVAGGASSGKVAEAGGVDPATIVKSGSVESEPLIALLRIIRSHERSALFWRSIRSQKHDGPVRRQMDLQTVETRLRQRRYSFSPRKLLRDLLLLFTNFIVTFPRGSQESVAAHGLRRLLSTHYSDRQMSPELSQPKPGIPEEFPPAKHHSSAPVQKAELQRKEADEGRQQGMLGVKEKSSRRLTQTFMPRKQSSLDKIPVKVARRKADMEALPDPPRITNKQRGMVVDLLKRAKLNSGEGSSDNDGPGPWKRKPRRPVKRAFVLGLRGRGEDAGTERRNLF